MVLLTITNVKQFMKTLLVSTAFDKLLLSEATIKMGQTFSIDGHLNPEFYTKEDKEFSMKLSTWESLRPYCFSIIKGQKTPLYFRFVFYLNDKQKAALLANTETALTPLDVDGLSLNIKYDGQVLTLTTATSLNIFTLDKSLEHALDRYVCNYLTSRQISFEQEFR